LSRRRAATAALLGALAVAAWFASLMQMSATEMGGRFSVGTFGFFIALWVLMMAAMMFPSVWPAVAIYGLVARRRAATGGARIVRSATFVGGYLCSWVLVGLAAYWLLALARAAGLDSLTSGEVARYGVAPITLLAALYELTPLKRACLRHCRGPLAFFMSNWRDGVRGAFKMGAAHGVYCVGCCWMLMVVLLALGAMSVTWMAVISIAIAVEKLAPAALSRLADRLLIAGLLAIGVIAVVRPWWLPGFGMAGSDAPMM